MCDPNTRVVEKLVGGVWTPVSTLLATLPGDFIRLYESDGRVVIGPNDERNFKVGDTMAMDAQGIEGVGGSWVGDEALP